MVELREGECPFIPWALQQHEGWGYTWVGPSVLQLPALAPPWAQILAGDARRKDGFQSPGQAGR